MELLTLFSIPKAFKGHIGLIQRNALRSWTLLRPTPQIILFGDDAGVAEAAAEFGFRHVPNLAVSPFGTPLFSDMFAQAQRIAAHELLCHVNADIILTGSLFGAIENLKRQCGTFSMFCTPWNLSVEHEIEPGPDWEDQLRRWIKGAGQPPRPVGVDTFLFPRGFYDQIPPFAVGRMAQDNWLLYRACRAKLPAVDATRCVLSVHQAHAGSTHYEKPAINAEFRRNRQLAGWWAKSFVAEDLPYELMEDGRLRKKRIRERLRPRIRGMSAPAWIHLLDRTYGLRRRLGLHRAGNSQPAA
jgi:hypothetical protein